MKFDRQVLHCCRAAGLLNRIADERKRDDLWTEPGERTDDDGFYAFGESLV